MADRIQLRRDTAANWTAYNPILLEGEPGIEIDTDQWKLGDGVHTWSQLAYRGGECVQQRGQSTTVAMSQKAVTDELNLIGVFDISAHNLTDGQPTKYADLTAALGTNGANVPEQYRVPGMTIRYVQSSDNKYVQYRLISNTFSTTESDWQSADFSNDIKRAISKNGYVFCNTASSTAEKTVTSSSRFSLNGVDNNQMLFVCEFTNANTANDATLNINNTGAYPLNYNGSRASATNTWKAGAKLLLYFESLKYRAIDITYHNIVEILGLGDNVVLSQKAVSRMISDLINYDDIDKNGISKKIRDFIMGDFRGTDGAYENSTQSAVTLSLVKLKKGDYIRCSSDYKFLLSDVEGNIVLNPWKTQYRAASDILVYIEVRNTAGTNMSSAELLELQNGNGINIERFVSNKECFISESGNNDNDGLTRSTPLASITKAIEYGFRNICVMTGKYVESLNVEGIEGINIYSDNYEATHTDSRKNNPLFLNGVDVSVFSNDGTYNYFEISNVPASYTNVFINHTVNPVQTSGSGVGSYNANLWARYNNISDDIRLKPVLTYSELSEANTFYYDGTNVYFNTTNIPNAVLVVSDNNNMFHFAKCNNLHISGIDVEGGVVTNLFLQDCNNVMVENCNFAYTNNGASYRGSNCEYENTDVTFNNCNSYKAKRDGFNGSYKGICVLNNCNSKYNDDDGESSHNYCTVVVNGGEYAYNGKGGHSPVHSCLFNCNGTYTHNNAYGFYLAGDSDHSQVTALITNSISKNNLTRDFLVTKYIVNLINVGYETETVNGGGALNTL